MNCAQLADTGSSVLPLAILGVLLLTTGGCAWLFARHRTRAAGATVVLAVVLLGLGGPAALSTRAAHADDCGASAAPTVVPNTTTPTPTPTDVGSAPSATPPVAQVLTPPGPVYYLEGSRQQTGLKFVSLPLEFPVAAQASATPPATIDPATIDLDPYVAGIQTTMTGPAGIWTATANAQGAISVSTTLPLNTVLDPDQIASLEAGPKVEYTIEDSTGAVSNIAWISLPAIEAP